MVQGVADEITTTLNKVSVVQIVSVLFIDCFKHNRLW